jgi:hypothetical protein
VPYDPAVAESPPPAHELTVVVMTYNMGREAPRTVRSLTRPYQRGVDDLDLELLVVDNASREPLDAVTIESIARGVRVIRYEDGLASPGPAMNRAVAATSSRFVGIVLDGARMVTPGTLAWAMHALRGWAMPFVTTMGWHLGPAHQTLSMREGYSQAVEDGLLSGIGWPADGYRLFEIASLAQANPGGWFGSLNESPCVFMPSQMFSELGGFDERFATPGGGYVNLEFFSRAIERPGARHIVLLGEGSFHQIHGGAATNAPDPGSAGAAFAAEYAAIIGRDYRHPRISPIYLGHMPVPARKFLLP